MAATDAGGAAATHAWLQSRAPAELATRTTVVGVRRSGCAVEEALAAAAACAIGEAVRDAGGHALIVLDPLRGHLALWDEAAAVAVLEGQEVDAVLRSRLCGPVDGKGRT